MTEGGWLSCENPDDLRRYLGDSASERKLRLFAVVCCRRIWDLIPVAEARRCVESAEMYAEGLADHGELGDAIRASVEACHRYVAIASTTGNRWGPIERNMHNAVGRVHRAVGGGRCSTHWATAEARAVATLLADSLAEGLSTDMRDRLEPIERNEFLEQAALFRDLFGNPFRPVTLDAAHRTHTVVSLA